MNPRHPSFEPDIEEQAALWAARLDGSSLTAADRAELEAWLAADPARRAMLSGYSELSCDLGHLLPMLAATGAVEAPRERKDPVRSLWAPRWIAAAGLAAAVVVAVLWTGLPRGRTETIATSAAQRRTFTLADGTRVELNANTSIQVENGRSERRVRLAGGEAFFEVSKDTSRPFIVETAAGSVRDTGTVFNVRAAAASELEVTVVEGSVEVRPQEPDGTQAAAPSALVAGDQLSAQDGIVSMRALSAGALDDALAWRKGLIVCNGMALSEAVARFARYNGLKVTVTPGAARQTVGGIFRIDDPGSFYEDLGTMYNVRVSHEADGSTRVSRATEP